MGLVVGFGEPRVAQNTVSIVLYDVWNEESKSFQKSAWLWRNLSMKQRMNLLTQRRIWEWDQKYVQPDSRIRQTRLVFLCCIFAKLGNFDKQEWQILEYSLWKI